VRQQGHTRQWPARAGCTTSNLRPKASYTSNLRAFDIGIHGNGPRAQAAHGLYQKAMEVFQEVQPYATSACGLKLLVHAALRY
jgi:hypothetical protein